jgi:ornithine carbamoyltransferase
MITREKGPTMPGPRHFLDLFDISPAEALALLDLADRLKRDDREGRRPQVLQGRILGLIFEKPSLRTRVSFEAAMARLGGNVVFLRGKDVGLGSRESVEDFARVISQYVDAIAIRTFAHSTIEELAAQASIPIINALSDAAHPCQAMADLLTIRDEKGRLADLKLTFVGDGNNVAMSLAVASALVGMEFVLSCPPGYEYPQSFRDQFARAFPSISLAVENDPMAAVKGADTVYTDVWASMGQEEEAAHRAEIFRPYQVGVELLDAAAKGAIFLHCLPAHRGEEVTAALLEDPRSLIIPQAANRLHFQKALLHWMLGVAELV